MSLLLQLLNAIGGFAGLASLVVLGVKWGRRDEAAKNLTARVGLLESRLDKLEDDLIERVTQIALVITRLESKLGQNGSLIRKD
jgi:hypothetical protein